MTTATMPRRPTRGRYSPLPPHGTSARGVGRPRYGIPGCKCQPCRDAKNKADQMRLLLNTSGRPVRIPAAPVADHIRQLLAAGMGWTRIIRAAHCSACTVHRILNGQELIRRTVAERILAVKARPAPGRYVNLTGTRRRIQALMAIGHTVTGIAHESSVDPSVITDILRGKIPRVRGVTAERIAAAYDWLGERPDTWSRKSATAASRNRAAREGWPPPAAWDDIDDPDSQPDWTGCCGTDRGWWMHKLEQLPMCGRCETAHADWLAEHRHLPQGERFKALGRARGEASGRGEAIAHDGRELMRVSGLDYEQAAERLGITKQHLQQELVRHPEMEAAA